MHSVKKALLLSLIASCSLGSAYARTSTILNNSQLYPMNVIYHICNTRTNSCFAPQIAIIASEKQAGPTYVSFEVDVNAYVEVIKVVELEGTEPRAEANYEPKACMDKQSVTQNGGVMLDDNHGSPFITCTSVATK
jgi:hypothetical protein